MNLKTLMIVELHVVAVVVIGGVLAWRFWYIPNQLQQAKPAVAAVVGVPPTRPETEPAPLPVQPAAQPAAQSAAQPAAQPAAQLAAQPAAQPAAVDDEKDNAVKNGQFAEGMKNWTHWQTARDHKEQLSVVPADYLTAQHALRICDPQGALIGVQQLVSVESGKVYRLSGAARSLGTWNDTVLFGGRVGFFMHGQPEFDLVWVTENTNWWEQSAVISNTVTGVGTLFVHMGYGKAPSTGEFTRIKFELCR